MSKFFSYTNVKEVFSKIGAALPGKQTTLAPQPIVFAAVAKEDLEAGAAVKVTKSNGVFFVEECDDADDFAGIVLADVHAQMVKTGNGVQQIYAFPAGSTVSVLRNGYVWVPVQDATPTIAHDGTVYIREAANATNTALPVGGLESALVSDETAALSGIAFTGNVGFPLQGTQNGTTVAGGLTGRTAEVKVELGLI